MGLFGLAFFLPAFFENLAGREENLAIKRIRISLELRARESEYLSLIAF